MLGDHLILYVSITNIKVFLITKSESNELLMDSVLQGFQNALDNLLKSDIDTRSIIDNLDYVLLAMDELSDDGYTLYEYKIYY